MNVGICMCVLLAALSSGSLSLPSQVMSQKAEGEARASDSLPTPSPNHTRHSRSAPAPPPGLLTNYNKQQQEAADARDGLSQLLARLISRKVSPNHSRTSLSSRASGPVPGHRITDRDYMGWMDFGRRSAEDYGEYSS